LPRFEIGNLQPHTRGMHEHQNRWRNKVWQKTLANHGIQIEDSLKKLDVLSIWSTRFDTVTSAQELIPETWMDGYVSLTFAGMGLHKYANMSLRSSLETALRFVYFSNHPIEFNWWKNGSRWYINDGFTHVWGKKFKYFSNLSSFKEFEEVCAKHKKLFGKSQLSIQGLYRRLSESIHTRAGQLQTSETSFSPVYERKKFHQWFVLFRNTQTCINIVFALFAKDSFKEMSAEDKKSILDIGVGSYYITELKEVVEK